MGRGSCRLRRGGPAIIGRAGPSALIPPARISPDPNPVMFPIGREAICCSISTVMLQMALASICERKSGHPLVQLIGGGRVGKETGFGVEAVDPSDAASRMHSKCCIIIFCMVSANSDSTQALTALKVLILSMHICWKLALGLFITL